MEDRTIKFTRRHEVQAAGGEVYEAGRVVTLPASSCEHFVNRGSAAYHVEEDGAAAKPTQKAKSK